MLRTNGKAKHMMEDASQITEDITYAVPSLRVSKEIVGDIDFSRIQKWTDPTDAMEQFYALVKRSPLHSVVVHIEPAVAKALREATNDGNRRLQRRHAERLGKVITRQDYEITGDTLKFSKTGRMLDGQHRLMACEKSDTAIITHVVFGLPDEIFDVLDQIKKRSASDVLELSGIKYATIMAGAVRWVMWYEAGARRTDDDLLPRQIRTHAEGRMKGIKEWINYANQIWTAYKQVKYDPSLVAAMLFMISKHDKALAVDFAESWLHGNRSGRNKNFDILSSRLQTIRGVSGGANVNRYVKAAMIVQMFNNWNASVVAAPRTLTWQTKWSFPKFEFDGAAFRKARDQRYFSDTSLKVVQDRVLAVLAKRRNKDGNAAISYADIANAAGVHEGQMVYIMGTMRRDNLLHLAKKNDLATNSPAIWRLKERGEKRLAQG